MVITSYSKVTYLDIVQCAENFVSLDISVHSTGWVKWVNGELTMGVYHIESSTDIERKFEFKDFLTKLFGREYFRYCFIEDVFGGTNFKTVKSLLQLNTLVDELIYEGSILVDEVKRENNGVWKRSLKDVGDYIPTIVGENDKAIIVSCMNNLEFDKKIIDSYVGEKIPNKSYQDIFDAMGMAVAIIKRDIIDVRNNVKVVRKCKSDLRKGYKVVQYDDDFEAIEKANSLAESKGREYKSIDLTGKSRDLLYNFKKVAEEYGDELIYVVTIETNKIGVLALDKGFDLTLPISYLLCYRNKIG